MGTTAATNHLLDRPQSKYGRVHFTGPGNSSAPSKCGTHESILLNVKYIHVPY